MDYDRCHQHCLYLKTQKKQESKIKAKEFFIHDGPRWGMAHYPCIRPYFSVDLDSHFFRHHELSLLGKRNNITRQDLLLFAKRQDIKDAEALIDQVTESVSRFRLYAEMVNIPTLCAE